MRKTICLGILVLMTLFCVAPAQSAGGEEENGVQDVFTPRFTYISLLNAGLEINNAGKATCIGHASAYDNTHTTRLTVQLQKSTSSGWSTVKSWSASSTGQSVAGLQENYYVVRGIYRVCSTAKIYNASGNLLESKSAYSDTATY